MSFPPPYQMMRDMTIGEVVEMQKLDCRHRSRCLKVAVSWPAMICFTPSGHECGAYEPLTDAERARDVESLNDLVGAILRHDRQEARP